MFSFMTKSAKQTISAPLTRATETSRCPWLLWPRGLRWRLAASNRVPDLQRLLSNPFALLFGSPARRQRSLHPMPTQKSLIGVRVPASAEFVGAFTNPKAAMLVYRYSILPRIVSVIAFDPGASSPTIRFGAGSNDEGDAAGEAAWRAAALMDSRGFDLPLPTKGAAPIRAKAVEGSCQRGAAST
jgi:hypothetical protein